jgi:hypothetical protein
MAVFRAPAGVAGTPEGYSGPTWTETQPQVAGVVSTALKNPHRLYLE